MAQQSNEHLTITQLSTYRDQELAPDELALCDAHLQTCQHCQETLADIQLTTAMLRRLPQVEVPRSFALPENIAVIAHTPEHSQPQPLRIASRRPVWKRALRSVSALAAVLGALFILTGALGGLPTGRTATSTSNLAAHAPGQTPPQTTTGKGEVSPSTHPAPQTPTLEPTEQATAAEQNGGTQDNNNLQSHVASSLPDAGTSAGQLEIGLPLLLLGILGIAFTRRSRAGAAR